MPAVVVSALIGAYADGYRVAMTIPVLVQPSPPAAEPGGGGFLDCRGEWHDWDEDE